MNRLWIRLSIVIAAIVVFVSLFPMLLRLAGFWEPPQFPRRSFDQLTQEQRAAFEADFESRTLSQIYRSLLAGSIIGVGVGALLSRGLAAPLKDLEAGAQAVAQQHLDYRVPITGSLEIQSVARSFNQMAAKLEDGERLRQHLLADVAHELRHPVHILQGSLQAILDDVYELNMEEIGSLLEQTQHLSALVDDLHELAQAEARKLPLHWSPVNLAELVSQAVDVFHPLATSQSIQLHYQPPQTAFFAEIDGGRIRQAIQNLLANALQHTPSGGTVAVSVEKKTSAPTAKEGDQYQIQVTDTGSGIVEEHLPHIFDRFYRADPNRSRELGGSGLGLAIAQAFVQAHGGEITVESPGPGKGSTFTIYLPAAAQHSG